ncbi:error-prone DNA polymerase [Mucilaginibacter koreensis]
MLYSELQATSNFSFLRGASHPEELVRQAAALGYKAIAITDYNSMAGIVRGHAEAKKQGIQFIPACRLNLIDGPALLAYPTNKAAYSRLSALLTLGNLRAEKGECHLYKEDVYQHQSGICFVVVPPAGLNDAFDFEQNFISAIKEYRQKFKAQLYLSANRTYQANDHKRLFRLSQLSKRLDIPIIATNDAYYHVPERRELQDVLTCVREKCTIDRAGFLLYPNAERYLKPVIEMQRLFKQYPAALACTDAIANVCTFSLDELKYIYPEEICNTGRTPLEELKYLTWKGAREHFGSTIPEKVESTLHHELKFVEEMSYANYFLFVYDIVRFAREQGILCQGRGSAANSAVCFCLGITSVDPSKFDLLFERFVSSARNEPPDIDVDFEHERREEVIQYIYNKYGRDRAAIVATVTQQRQKGAIRDVGKAMGLSVDTVNRLSAAIWEHTDEWFDARRLVEQGLSPDEPLLKKVIELTAQMLGFPRQLGQHTGGFVVTQGKLSDLCPIMNARMVNRTNIEWNKDDIDVLGFLKVDVLALGMLTCISKAFKLCEQYYNHPLTLATVPQDDPGVYQMASRADTIGVFQIESRAQQAMLPRLKPKKFYDLVVEVAIVRPGPIQGDMVHPYILRRNGEEPVEYPSPELEAILNRTLGVPLFQEQAMKIAIVAAGFTPAEADELRRSMATFKFKGLVNKFQEKLINGMLERGYTEEFAQRIFKQLEGFGSYGFPESHAASFALLVYVSLWLKCYYPDVFAVALLNSQPMGFYHPAQIIIDARKHGVEFRPVDVNYSEWDYTLEKRIAYYAPVRIGFRQVRGVRDQDIITLIANRGQPYQTIAELHSVGVSQATLEKLADADAFGSMKLSRRQALWEVAALQDTPLGLFKDQPSENATEAQIQLPFMHPAEQVMQDYASLSLSLKAHPISFIRQQLSRLNILSSEEITNTKAGTKIKAAGVVLSRQRPGTAGGVCFITIEDETGTANLVLFEKLFDIYRKEILGAKLLMVEGWLQREGQVVHVIVNSCHDLTGMFSQALAKGTEMPFQVDNKRTQVRENAVGEVLPKARNFR